MADNPYSKAPDYEPNKQYAADKEYTGTVMEVWANVRTLFYYMITPDAGQGVRTDQQARVESADKSFSTGDKVVFKPHTTSFGNIRKA